MRKKLLFTCLIVIVVMVFAGGAFSAYAAEVVHEGTHGENLTWSIDSDGTLTISGEGAMAEVSGTQNYPWAIHENDVTEIVIEDGVTTIGENSFAFFEEVKTITIGKDVSSVGRYAFQACYSVENIYWNAINAGDFSFGNYIFQAVGKDATSLNITFEDTVEHIPAYFFYSDSNSAALLPPWFMVYIGKNVNSIGEYAFFNCPTFKGFRVDSQNEYYSNDSYGALYNSDRTEFFQLPMTVTGEYTISSKTVKIHKDAFRLCDGLTEIGFPDDLTEIGETAFFGCAGLTEIKIPNAVTSVGISAFAHCEKLNSILWNAEKINDHNSFKSIFGSSGSKEEGITVVFGDTVERIPSYLFGGTSSGAYIKEVTLGKNITSIGTGAFYNCAYLSKINWNAKSVNDFTYQESLNTYFPFKNIGSKTDGVTIVFGNEVEHVPAYVFSSKPSYIVSVSFGSGLKSIGKYSFAGTISTLTIPENVTYIGNRAFADCTITNLIWNAKNIESFGEDASPGIFGKNLFSCISFGNGVESIPPYFMGGLNGADVEKVIMSNSITSIGKEAFEHCTSLAEINLSEKLETIGNRAFANCEQLKEITIPESVKTFGNDTFARCIRLEKVYWNPTPTTSYSEFSGAGNYSAGMEVIFNDNITSIPDLLFSGCNALRKMTLPPNTTSIGERAFFGSTLLVIDIPESISHIGDGAFGECHMVTQLNWNPKSVNDFNILSEVFSGLGNVSTGVSVVFGDEVEKIPPFIFHSLSSENNIKTIHLGKKVELFDQYLYEQCYNIENITVDAENLFFCSDEAGALYNKAQTVLYKYPPKQQNTSYSLHDQTEVVNQNAFRGCTALEVVDLSENILILDRNAFYDCENLRIVNVPSTLNSVYLYAFGNCENIETVTFFGPKSMWDIIYIESGNENFSDKVVFSPEGTFAESFVSADGKTFTLYLYNINESRTAVLALYKNSKLVEIIPDTTADSKVVFETTADYDTAKIMVWQKFSNLNPILGTDEITVFYE